MRHCRWFRWAWGSDTIAGSDDQSELRIRVGARYMRGNTQMRTIILDRGFLAIILAACLGCDRDGGLGGDNVIEYRGQAIKLSRSYYDYDDYKNDPDNLDPGEIARVQKLLIEAPIVRSFASRAEMIGALSQIRFPGYGSVISFQDG